MTAPLVWGRVQGGKYFLEDLAPYVPGQGPRRMFQPVRKAPEGRNRGGDVELTDKCDGVVQPTLQFDVGFGGLGNPLCLPDVSQLGRLNPFREKGVDLQPILGGKSMVLPV